MGFDLKDYGTGTGGLGEEFFELFEGLLVQALKVQAKAEFGGTGRIGKGLEGAGFLKGETRAGFFDLNADFEKKRMPRFEDGFQARKAFGKGEEFLDAGHVLEGEDGPASAFFGAHGASADNESGDGDLLAVALTIDLVEGDERRDP